MKTRPLPVTSSAVLVHRTRLARIRRRAAATTALVAVAAGAELAWRWWALPADEMRWPWAAAGLVGLAVAVKLTWGLSLIGWARQEGASERPEPPAA